MPGLDRVVLDQIDLEHIIKRVQTDVRTDFILAPHYNFIYTKASDVLAEACQQKLRSGTYTPNLPLTISVPKEWGFTRPGSILNPIDRVIYHALADQTTQQIEGQLDRNRVFSHVVENISTTDELFQPAQECWKRLQEAVASMGSSGGYILKADISNYFERLPQHHLINLLVASGVLAEVKNLLEEMLLAFRQRDSYGIIQGLFPSDIFGNFYLSGLDSYCDMHDIPSARFVDDFYLHFNSEIEAKKGLIRIQENLRKEGLHLNERKSGIYQADELIREETFIDTLFEEARKEIKEEWFEDQGGYGFAIDWIEDFEEPEEEEVELQALVKLFNSRSEYKAQSDKIEKFCLPVFRALGNDLALESALASLNIKPHLTRLYLSYISRFARNDEAVASKVASLLEREETYTDYQRMYLLSTLLQARQVPRVTSKIALKHLENRESSQELRAVAAIVASKFGTPTQRRAVRTTYESEQSTYVRCALLYSARYFTQAEQRTCIKAWGAHTAENSFVARGLKSL